MSNFILAWVLVTSNGNSLITYSPVLATLQDCERIQKFAENKAWSYQCIQVNVLKVPR